MEEKLVKQRGNTLCVNFSFNKNMSRETRKVLSKVYVINSVVKFQLMLMLNNQNTVICVKFAKHCLNDDLMYTINLNSRIFDINNKCFTCNDYWHLVLDTMTQESFSFDVDIKIDILSKTASFASLYDDHSMTDFVLRGEDGSIHLHKAVLAASSPVLLKMLSGPWKETKEGVVDIPGTSSLTLQHFKDYIYLNKLPESGLEQVLLLATYYMMPDMQQKCINNIITSLTAHNFYERLEFAFINKDTKLVLAILECMRRGEVKLDDIRSHLLSG